jgi:glycosyltransferase involved in cell wall biosynthesis
LISKSDVIMVPSVFESFGLIAAEGLMGGAGVCAYSGSGVEEYITHAPYSCLLPVGSTTDFAKECAKLARDIFNQPELRKENIEFAKLNFEAETIAKKLALYFS